MILTTLGIDQVNRDLETKITRVVFSDLSLHYVTDPSSLTDVIGGNTNSVEPVVGLLYNGALNVQATNNAQFKAQSAFIYAKNDKEFLIAVSLVRKNKVDCELRINNLRKLSFNAIAANLVTKGDIREAMASAIADKANVADLDSYIKKGEIHTEFDSLTDSIVSAATSSNAINLASKADSSMVDSKLASKANIIELSNYATKASLSSVVDAIPSAIDLSSYVVADSLSNYATNSALTSYATTSLVKSIASDNSEAIFNVSNEFSNYATKKALSEYATNSQLSSVVDAIPSSANLSGYVTDNMLSRYVTSDRLSSYALNSELSNYATNNQLSSAVNSIDLTSYVTNSKLSSYANQTSYDTERALSSYATNSQLRSVADTIPASVNLSGYVTESMLSSYALSSELSNYATTSELASYVTDVRFSSIITSTTSDISNVANKMSDYATSSELNNVASGLSSYATNSQLSSVANTIPASVNLSGYVTESTLSSYVLSSELSSYATTSELASYVTNGRFSSIITSTTSDISNVANKLNDYATNSALATVSNGLSSYATNSQLGSVISSIPSSADLSDYVVKATLSSYVNNSDVAKYATKEDASNFYKSAVSAANSYAEAQIANVNNVVNSLSTRLDGLIPSAFKTIMYGATQAPSGWEATGSIYPNGTIYKVDAISDIKGMPTDFINSIGIPASSPALVFYNHETGNANGGWKILNVCLIKDYVVFAFNILAKTSNAKDFKSSSSLPTVWGQGWLNYSNRTGNAPFTVANGTVTGR